MSAAIESDHMASVLYYFYMKNNYCNAKGAFGGGTYFLGFIGAAVYYISHSTGFWMGVLGFLKAIVWPAFLVHGVLSFIGR